MAYTTINKGTDHFNTKLYSGTGSSQAITGVGFQPDWTWIKQRTGTQEHWLVDAVRGTTKFLESNSSNAESSDGATGFTSFDSDGFTVNTSARTNQSSNTYASWNWKANGAGSSNTDGTITSTVSANTTAGFSIVKWTSNGADSTTNVIGHGLGVAPKVMFYKPLITSDWYVWLNKAYDSSQDYLKLNTTDNKADLSSGATPTSTLMSNFGFGNGVDMIAYCFAEIPGYSKMGYFKGVRPFVFTGFKPAMVIIKTLDTIAENWNIMDNKRDSYNGTGSHALMPSTTGAEYVNNSGWQTDFLSNGFKINGNQSSINYASTPYLYMAFAEAPIVGTNNVPCTAR